ncbi:hypothetical protein SCHPADRAFT_852687 [Schizopora paradoxa]|uniref:CST complex subunit STN1 n=1 Tax=Schizopora paradoxa TaxID=27342 RepID=A0A0H2RN77_9AGAM|nr:hypothetical protein SCHPADRAFT_852687 [Schizopora paradoxa]
MSFTETISRKATTTLRIRAQSPEKKNDRESFHDETASSVSDIVKWTFRPDSIAPCFVKDVFEMKEDLKGEFYWLGRVPCRMVRIVGLIVGIVQHDDNTRYNIDDGSGVIDCLQKNVKPPPSPKKSGKGAKPTSAADPRPLPPPVAEVGAVIRVEGRVCRARGSKVLRVERGGLFVCRSANDEPRHWAEVVRLQKESYSLEGPFVVPLLQEPSTPQRPPKSQLMSCPASSPVKCLSSPVKPSSDSLKEPASPPRLRHPSKLRTRDLTDATFRIYVKHYIDNAPELQHVSSLSILGGPSQENTRKSFTLGYLRRVPLLADMARSVVKAERKRRDRESRKRAETQNHHPTASRSNTTLKQSSESTSRKTKRLFVQTIRNLYAEGSIFISDGPKCVHQPLEETSQHSFLWKDSSSTVTSVSTQGTTTLSQEYDSSMELSDEDPNEEAYIPMSQSYIAELVLDAMRNLSTRTPDTKDRSRFQNPSAEDITSYLRKADERWANLGEWAIKEALEYLETEEYIFKAGKGRWALCL